MLRKNRQIVVVYNMEDLKTAIEKCKTVNQVYKVLAKYNRTVIKDESAEFGGRLSIWIDDKTRIYQSVRGMIYQTWYQSKEDDLPDEIIDNARMRIKSFVQKYACNTIIFNDLSESEKYDFILLAVFQTMHYNYGVDIRSSLIRAVLNAEAAKGSNYKEWQYKTLNIG